MAKHKTPLENTKPKQEFNAIYQAGLKAQTLASQYQAKIGIRLSAAFLTAFAADLDTLSTSVPATLTMRDGKVQLTAAQTSALRDGYMLVKGIRTTVKGHHPSKDVLLAYGIGTKTSKLVVKDVEAALQTILDRLAAQPTEAASFDIVQPDVDALNAALATIKAADLAQEKARAAAPQTTQQRNAAANHVLADVKKIAGAGMRACVDDATAYASFEGLVQKGA